MVRRRDDVVAAWAPGLHEALVGLGEGDFVIVDGTLISTGRIKTDEPYYAQKRRKHGRNVQVVVGSETAPRGGSPGRGAGRTHDLTAARAHGIVQACVTRQVPVLAGRACRGAGATVRTPRYRHREQPEHYRQGNRDPAWLRACGERAFARLKRWRVFRKAPCST
ncbi:transposase family protein, partial [Streptomyces violascens]|uniref:transposase family protein n=1 Tax=Streptomyces violascens TaxID=67381 RepID=UPI0036CAB6F1